MKVFFIPETYYLSYLTFLNVIVEAKKENIDAYMLTVFPFARKWEEKIYTNEKFIMNDCPRKKIYLFPNIVPKKRYESLIENFVIMVNSIILLIYMIIERPDAIVINSDLGGTYIRMFQEICLLLKKKIFIIYNHRIIDNKSFSKSKSKIWKYFKVLSFSDYRIGAYTQKSTIFAASNKMKDEIIALGIDSSRVIVVGDPRKSTNIVDVRRANEKNKIVILYCTEVMQEIYSKTYVFLLNKWLKKMFVYLAKNHDNLEIVVKLHPREKEHPRIDRFYSELFGDSTLFKIIDDQSLNDEILISADIVVAHYTDMLRMAAWQKKVILSIELYNKSKFSLFTKRSQTEKDMLVQNISELQDKMSKAILNSEYRAYMSTLAYNWVCDIDENQFVDSSKAAEKIAIIMKDMLLEN
ncbi:MAG: hypothetical protein WCV63_04560 [Negativicutes bacterium]|jgi:hypothetical protein